MSLLEKITGRRLERPGFELYGAAVAAARDPYYYGPLAVPDTLDGRFDLVGLFVALLIRSLRQRPAPGPDLAQAVFDAMFTDMDNNLREIGVSDYVIAKRMKAMWEAFHGRALAYDAALDAGDAAALASALARNVWREAAPPGSAARLAAAAFAQDRHLAGQTLADFAEGRVGFLAAEGTDG